MSGVRRATCLCLFFAAASVEAQPVAQAFTPTKNLLFESRQGHTATLLQNGAVLITGGYGELSYRDSTEVIDAAGNVASFGLHMVTKRWLHTATLLKNGKVLLAGGYDGAIVTPKVELYDPSDQSLTELGTLKVARVGHTATLLNDGRVLVTGGSTQTTGAVGSDTAELYNPSDGTSVYTNNVMSSRRHVHAAALLPDGRVMVSGGASGGGGSTPTVDIFNPANGLFTPAISMSNGRYHHSMTVLPDGRVLIAGGYDGGGGLNLTEIYQPSGNGKSPGATLAANRYKHTATLLPNGTILMAGGDDSPNSAEIYDPRSEAHQSQLTTASVIDGRALHTATLLPTGNVLLIGGDAGGLAVRTMEVFRWSLAAFTPITSIEAPLTSTATALVDGRVLVVGGAMHDAAQVFDPADGAFHSTGSLKQPRELHTATLLPNGKVLIIGGYGFNLNALSTAELYDPENDTFEFTGSMRRGRLYHTATLMANGKVLIAGGANYNFSNPLSDSEIYDPMTGQFTDGGQLRTTNFFHTATLLRNGKVMLYMGDWNIVAAQLYDPAADRFDELFRAPFPPGIRNRVGHTATTLPDGTVLMASGDYVDGKTVDDYDPYSNTGTQLDDTSDVRRAAAALPDGRVLLAGGANYSDLYDPVTRKYAVSAALTDKRNLTVAPLPDGKLLISPANETQDAGVYDPTPELQQSRRPTLAPVATICEPGTLTLSGTGMNGGSEGSSGASGSSAGNAPLVRLQRLHDGITQLVPPTEWSATQLTASFSDLMQGWYRLSVVSNAIPSVEQVVEVGSIVAPLLGSYSSRSIAPGESIMVPASAPPVYSGTAVRFAVTGSAGFTGDLSVHSRTGLVTVSNAGPFGIHTITVSAWTSCAVALSRTFSLTVMLPAPDSVIATAASEDQVDVSWAAVSGASSYSVFRSSMNGSYGRVGSTNGTSFPDTDVDPDTTYFYRVQAMDNNLVGGVFSRMDFATTTVFTDDPLQPGITPFKAAHINQARTAVNAVRQASGLGLFAFSVSPLLPGALIKAEYVLDLRTALNEALKRIEFATVPAVNPATAGTIIRAADLTEIRNAVK